MPKKPSPSEPAQSPVGRGPSPAAERASISQTIKLSATIFPADDERIAEICMALAKHGHRITTSHAIRLALRAVEMDETKLLQLLDEMKDEDGRTRRFAKDE